MPDIPKILAIIDLIMGVAIAFDGVVAIIWTFDFFFLSFFIIGGYLIFFGVAISLLAVKGWAFIEENAPFMNKNGGKAFAYAFLCSLTVSNFQASWLAAIFTIMTLLIMLVYIALTFVPALQHYKAGKVCGPAPDSGAGAGAGTTKQENPATAI